MTRRVITGGTVIDGAGERRGTVLIAGDRIVGVTQGPLPSEFRDAPELSAEGAWVVPGFVCLRTHVGEPGYEWREDVASVSLAGAAGGYTTLCAAPDTDPVNDVRAVTEQLMTRSAASAGARVVPVGAATRALEGKHLSEIGDLAAAGCVAVSTGDTSLASAQMMRRVLEYCRSLGVRVFVSPMDVTMARGGLMNEGYESLRLGLPGVPAEAEAIAILRDGWISRLAEWPVHFQRVSSAAGVRALELLRAEGIAFTADCTPHHLWFTDEAVSGFDTVTKVSPPLRTRADVLALRAAVADGLIGAIATDHAPRTQLEKWVEYDNASPGTTGLETALGVVLELVRQRALPRDAALARLSAGPAAVLGRPELGRVAEGCRADLAIVEPDIPWRVDGALLRTRGQNHLFEGQPLSGQVRATLVGGRVVDYDGAEAVKRAYR